MKQFRLELSFALLALLAVWAWTAGHLLTGLIVGLAATVAGGIMMVRWGRVVPAQADLASARPADCRRCFHRGDSDCRDRIGGAVGSGRSGRADRRVSGEH